MSKQETRKAKYWDRKNKKKCTTPNCKNKPYVNEDTGERHARCLNCLDYQAALQAIRSEKLKKKRKCVNCGHDLEPHRKKNGFKKCESCEKKATESKMATYRERIKRGVCRVCEMPTSIKKDGKHYTMCDTHRKIQKKYDDARAEKAKRDQAYRYSLKRGATCS